MKRSDAFPPNYLGQDDVPTPILATIAGVHTETMIDRDTGGMRDKPVMTFAEQTIKPLIINNINWTICEQAYGDDSDAWIGKTVELFVDPNIMFGKRRTGGLRLRVPTGRPTSPLPRNGNGTTPPATRPQFFPPKPAAPNGAAPPKAEPTIDEKHKLVLDAFAAAKTEARVKELAKRAAQLSFAPHHVEEQSDAYHDALGRIAAKQPALVHDDIQF